MIAIENLRYRHLSVDSYHICPGMTSVIGPNGSGKTTFLKLLAGILLPETGLVTIDGITPRMTEIGWVGEFPDRNILFGRVCDEIASPLRFRHLPCKEIRRRVGTIMDLVKLTPFSARQTRNLSGGEKVLTSLAAALVIQPRVLILDELDSHLNADRVMKIEELIRQSRVPYIIRSTQDPEAAARSDNVLFLEKGAITAAGRPESVFAPLAESPYYPLSWRIRTWT